MGKWVLRVFLLILAAITVLAVNAIWFKPFSSRVFYERVFLEFGLESPELLTQLRMLESIGIRSHNAKLDDRSQQAGDAQQAKLKADLATLRQYDRNAMSEQEKLSYDMLEWFMAHGAEGEQWRYHGYPVNQLFGVQNALPNFMVNSHPLHDLTDAEHYIARLDQFNRVFLQVVEDLQIRANKGVIPPRFVLEKVLAEMQGFTKGPVDQQLLYKHFAGKVDAIEGIDAETATALKQKVATAIESSVLPAYQHLTEYLQALLPQTTTDDGVWKLPNGEAYYAYMLKEHTTTDLTPAQIHQLGLDEVARIQQQMLTTLQAQGISGDHVPTMMKALGDDPRFLYPDTAEARLQILADYKTILADINTRLDGAFNIRPKAAMDVQRVPEFSEKTAPGAYYNAPAMDGSRPGVFYANLYNIKATPKFSMKTLAVHEGIPGHHFQIAIQQELQGLPTFRKILPFTVYAEGWALYTEQLMAERGLYQDDPFGDLGRLQDELFRAIRLVVDTGIHHHRWTREQAIEYMAGNSGMAASDVEAEIERYIVMPGQACAYKIGMLKIVELRNKAQTELGEKFKLTDFHDVVLKNGSMPITILQRVVEQYISDTKAKA
ncbi:hypothetical protein A5320_01385 [Rheinheimera sp. SA_1]|uniref:DUF885 domain-containing protein n=1 Tax=Rheinheimera sp. SA_1 TaxID=1827365 RepID=UPI0007FDCF61|nr:DUF885 domain-containing protein [Rheinheimera sp. SA_1]OBP16103.1 hypothetical protein A5320_01385 [Rheinheimera sp. SA_1]